MRRPKTLMVCFLTIAAVLILTRSHIQDLAAVARTYATYHNTMRQHPEILYRFPSASANVDADSSQQQQHPELQAPKILHQIYLQGDRNSTLHRYDAARASCQTLHPTWTPHLWTDDNATAFMRDHYPLIAPHYGGYAQSIQRANILRYALLHHFGGVYLDLDVTCLVPLDELLHLPWLTPGAYPVGVNNAFILARPGHGFLDTLLQAVPQHDLWWPLPYVANMLSTGCMFFTNRWMEYVRSLARNFEATRWADRVFILADQEGAMEPHMLRGKMITPLFAHGGASSWHGWDAAVIVLIGKHYVCFLALVMVGIVGLVALGCKLVSHPWAAEAHRGARKERDEEEILTSKERWIE